ncbi:MAG TPA: GAF domain-containing protein [Ktedonobacteraceae bacterium]|nr:GAF domain-containing protein [Ktedonobacteraceae bacterium]
MLESSATQQVEYFLRQHEDRLRSALQYATQANSGPEKGSDAWLLLTALISDDRSELDASFEQSGRALAQHGGKLEARILGLQTYVDALAREFRGLFDDHEQGQMYLLEANTRLFQLHSLSLMALTRGYQSVVDQVFLARQRMERLLEKRLQVLQRINSISNSAIDLDQALESITRQVADELRTELCSVFFYDEMQRVLTLRATNEPRPMGGMHYTLRLGEGYSGWVAEKGSPVLTRDALGNPAFASEARAYGQEYSGLMSLPIIFFGNVERLIGVINVQTRDPRDFSGEEMNFVEVVAGMIAINVENGRLYEQTDEQLRRKVHELATLHRVSSIIASTLDLDRVLQIITTQAVQLSGADRSCIFELDEDRRCLGVIAHYGLNSADVQGIQVPVGHCCAGRAVSTGRPSMAVDCFHSDEQCFMRHDPLASADMHSVLCVPLQVKQKVLGCICIYSSHRHMLSQEQMQLVITFANEAAIAIDNARLFEEARRGLEIKTTLLRELHHRVKNNLATVAGILSLQRRRTRSPEVRYILAESVNRVQGLAATHDLLSHEDVSEARVDDIARKIVGVANANLRPPETHIVFEVTPCPVVIPSRAVEILALVLNEMVSNAIKHGIDGQPRGAVTIRGREEHGEVVVEVLDTGKGPASLPEEESSEGLGLSLIKNLIGDLGGSYVLRRTEEMPPRTCAEVRFPLKRRL